MREIAKYELNGLADNMRWKMLYDEGGLLVDADSICLCSLDEHLLDHEAFACWENEISRAGLIAAAYVGCNAGNTFIGQIINNIFNEESVTHEMAWKTVGPERLTDSFRKYNYQTLKIFPSHFFIPEHFSGIVYNGDGPIYAYQEWASTRNTYDELYLKPINEVGRSLKDIRISNQLDVDGNTHLSHNDNKDLNELLNSNDSISSFHSPYFGRIQVRSATRFKD